VVDHLAKPAFGGAIDAADLRGAVVEARAAAADESDHDRLRQIIGEIKTRAAASNRQSARRCLALRVQ
jgi:hypothetical protein